MLLIHQHRDLSDIPNAKKYELVLTDTKTINHPNGQATTLFRIIAIRDIPRYNITAGDLGGYVESENNLSQNSDCDAWVSRTAQVYGDAHVKDNCYLANNTISSAAQLNDLELQLENQANPHPRKYELILSDTQTVQNSNGTTTTLYRIRALRKITRHNVKKGDLGGYVESEYNLAQFARSDAWIADNARVFRNARVFDHAKIADNAQVYSNAQIYDNAQVYGSAHVYGTSEIYDNAQVHGNAHIYHYAKIYNDARVYGSARIFHYAQVSGSSRIFDTAQISGYAQVDDNAQVSQNAHAANESRVSGAAQLTTTLNGTQHLHVPPKYGIEHTSKIVLSANGEITRLYRIRALRDIPLHNVKNGDLGGYIETEHNLSQAADSNAWIADHAQVFENATVYDNAKIYGDATVHGNAHVHGNAQVYDNADIWGNAHVYDYTEVSGAASVTGTLNGTQHVHAPRKYELISSDTQTIRYTNETQITLYRIRALRDIPLHNVKTGDLGGYVQAQHNLSQSADSNAWVADNALVFGDATISDNALVAGNAIVRDLAQVYGNATIQDHSEVHNRAKVYDHAKVSGAPYLTGVLKGNQRLHVSLKYNLVLTDTQTVVSANGTLVTLYRIRALRDIPLHNVKKGDLGGYVEKDYNLAQFSDSSAWISNNAKVYGNATVCFDALVSGNAQVSGTAHISGNARIDGNVHTSNDLWGTLHLSDNTPPPHFTLLSSDTIPHPNDPTKTLLRIQALVDIPHHNVKAGDLGGYAQHYANLQPSNTHLPWVADNAKIYDHATLHDNAFLLDNAQAFGNAQVTQNAKISDNAQIHSHAHVSGSTLVYGSAVVMDYATVSDHAQVGGTAYVGGSDVISGTKKIIGIPRKR